MVDPIAVTLISIVWLVLAGMFLTWGASSPPPSDAESEAYDRYLDAISTRDDIIARAAADVERQWQPTIERLRAEWRKTAEEWR